MASTTVFCVIHLLIETISSIPIRHLLILTVILVVFLVAMAPNLQHYVLARLSPLFNTNYFSSSHYSPPQTTVDNTHALSHTHKVVHEASCSAENFTA